MRISIPITPAEISAAGAEADSHDTLLVKKPKSEQDLGGIKLGLRHREHPELLDMVPKV